MLEIKTSLLILKNSEWFGSGFTFTSQPSDYMVIWFPEDLFLGEAIALCTLFRFSTKLYHLL